MWLCVTEMNGENSCECINEIYPPDNLNRSYAPSWISVVVQGRGLYLLLCSRGNPASVVWHWCTMIQSVPRNEVMVWWVVVKLGHDTWWWGHGVMGGDEAMAWLVVMRQLHNEWCTTAEWYVVMSLWCDLWWRGSSLIGVICDETTAWWMVMYCTEWI